MTKSSVEANSSHEPDSASPVPVKRPGTLPLEWPTWVLILAVYGTWLGLVGAYPSLPAWVSTPGLIVVTAWFMSLQHELLHGHPTRNTRLNRLLGLVPLSAWYPYDIYRESHLAHHRDDLLTFPGIDPECNYVTPEDYARLSPFHRYLLWATRTALGRFLIGPGLTIPAVWKDIGISLRARNGAQIRMWVEHLVLLAIVLWWVQVQAGIAPLHYLLGIAYPALGLAMLRSFYEHRPAADPAHRIVINEAALPWRLLYLNNNFHSVHHALPSLPWYAIPAHYRADRTGYLRRNGDFHLNGYGKFLLAHAIKPVDSPVHPGTPAVSTSSADV